MRRLTRLFARLYPAPWRARYGDEFEALLDDSGIDWRTSINVLSEAIKMHLAHWSFRRSAAVGLISGLAVALTIAFLLPEVYRSQAVLRGPTDPAESALFTQRSLDVLSRSTLTNIIQRRGLYRGQLQREPMDDVVELMRRNIFVELVPARGAVEVAFTYSDRFAAQQTVMDIASSLSDSDHLRFVDTASLPTDPIWPNHSPIVAGGVIFGLLAGIAFALFVRRRHGTVCPTCGRRVAHVLAKS